MPLILIFLIGLTFNNAASAGIFAAFNMFLEGNDIRCSVTYSRDNSISTKLETKKPTTQFTQPYYYKDYDYCNKGAKNLAKKINKWLKKDKNNILLDFDKPLRCKEGWGPSIVRSWSQVYTPCAEKYNQQLLDLLTDKYPDQIKTKLIKKQIYADYSSGTVDWTFTEKCTIEYTQLDLTTGNETTDKYTTNEFVNKKYCKEGAKRLGKKLVKWANKKYTNIVADIDVVRCNIENYLGGSYINFHKWGEYADCPAEYGQQIADDLIAKIPTQISSRVRNYEFKPTQYD